MNPSPKDFQPFCLVLRSSYYNEEMKDFRKLENDLLKLRVPDLKISEDNQKKITSNLERRIHQINNGIASSEFKSENPSIKIEDSLQIQIGLLINKLGTVANNENFINSVVESFKENGRIKYDKIQERERTIRKFNELPTGKLTEYDE